MQELITSTFKGNDVRSLSIDGEMFVVASDVAKALGYGRTGNFTRLVKDKYKGSRNVSTPGGEQETTVLSEPGVMQALATIRKDVAEQFQDWLYEDVLPSIRENGSYGAEKMTPIQALAQTTQHLAEMEEKQSEMDNRLSEIEREKREAKRQLDALPEPEFEAPEKTPSKMVNEIVNAYVDATTAHYGDAWGSLYREINYRLGINLQSRLNHRSTASNKMDVLREDGLMRLAHSIAVKKFSHALGDKFLDYYQNEYEEKAVI
jgi:prophage antirepressor-like protein